MLLRRGARPKADDWRNVLEILALQQDYDERIDGVLAEVIELSGLPDSYLYLSEPGGRYLHLERARARPAGDPSRTLPDPMLRNVDGGVETTAPLPPLEVPLGDEDKRDRVVATPVGRLWSVALPASDGSLVGVIQSGPLSDGQSPAGAERALAAARFPLALVVERARREHTLAQRLAAASGQLGAGRRLAGSAMSFDRFVSLLLDMALKSTRTDAGFVAVVDPVNQSLGVRADANMPPRFAQEVDLSPQTGLFDWSPASHGGALILRDVDAALALGIRSLLAVPLMEGDAPLGLIALANFGEAGTFDEQSLELLETFAEQIRLMLHNARLFDTFSERYLETAIGLARSLDARRPHTRGHHGRMSRTAGAIAMALGLDAPYADAIRDAGLVHDVGLAASAGLEGSSDVDLEHPTIGASLLEHLPLHPDLAPSVATHHEWFDGWGFPEGLHDERIPLGGRILGVSEFLTEMAAGDAVRPPWPDERLAVEVAQRRGSQFDPAVADVAVRLLHDGALRLHDDDASPNEESQ